MKILESGWDRVSSTINKKLNKTAIFDCGGRERKWEESKVKTKETGGVFPTHVRTSLVPYCTFNISMLFVNYFVQLVRL